MDSPSLLNPDLWDNVSKWDPDLLFIVCSYDCMDEVMHCIILYV